MPNSDATITRTNLLKRAFRRIGVDTPSTSEQASAVDLLNDIVKEIDSEGRWLWTISNSESPLTLIAGQRSYGVGSGPSEIANYIMALEKVEEVQGTSLIQYRIIDTHESITTYERESPNSQPYLVYLATEPLMSAQRMHFFPTPNAGYAVQYSYRRRLFDFDNPSDNPDFPQDWNQRLVKRLSYELSPEFGIPLQERQLLKQEMDEAMKMGKAANSEEKRIIPVKTEYF